MQRVKYLLAIFLLLSLFSTAQNVTVAARITGLKEPHVEISYSSGTEMRVDSVMVRAEKFEWKAPMPEAQKVLVRFARQAVPIYVESEIIHLTGTVDSLNKLKVSGSRIHDEFERYKEMLKDIDDKLLVLFNKNGKANKEERLAISLEQKELSEQRRGRVNNYISTNTNSALSLFLLADKAVIGEYRDVKELYDKLDKSLLQTIQGKLLSERLAVLKRSDIGQKMADFTQYDTSGAPVKLSGLRGKYVLVDFWASWCVPCRAENPNLLIAYHTYKDKNFTVVGISLDDKKANWTKAIIADKLPWIQLSDLKGRNNEVSTYYGVKGIPSSLLIDPDGKIIAKDLRGELLHKKLAELFSKGS